MVGAFRVLGIAAVCGTRPGVAQQPRKTVAAQRYQQRQYTPEQLERSNLQEMLEKARQYDEQ